MKGKIFFVSAFLCFLSFSVFADDYLFFGVNYSNTISNGDISHGIGGNFSAIGDYGGYKRIYGALGFTADITSNRDLLTKDLKKLGVSNMDSHFFYIPLRIGYPIFFDINEATRFLLIPSMAFDIDIFNAKFSQNMLGYKVNYELSGWGYSFGMSLNLGMQHKLGKVYLRYGVDFDMPFFSMLIVDVKYSGYIRGSSSGSEFIPISDVFTLTTSPYISVGFKI